MKNILILIFLFIGIMSYGQLDTINIGTAPNDGTGESLRSGMIKVNIAIRQLDTAYMDRLKWDGGATGLTAATGRTSLGATTIGAAFFMLTNPGAITFPRINADNTLTAQSAADFKTSLSLQNVTNESKATMFTSPTFTGHPTIEGVTMTGATGTGNLVFSASPTLSGTIALGAGNLTMTGSLATTGSRVTKGWFADLEITNLPTINGGTLKTALSLIAADVGLGNVTNESKATMFTNPTFTGTVSIPAPFNLGGVSMTSTAGELNVLDGISGGLTATELSVLDGIPGTLTATELGYVDGVSSSIQTQLGTKLNLADSVNYANGYMSRYDGVTGLALKLNLADSVNDASGYMSHYDGTQGLAGKVALGDSGVYAGGYSTPTDLDEAVEPFLDTVALETIVQLLSDSAIYIPFLIGGGDISDTALFTVDSIICGSFYNYKDTLVAVYLNGVLMSGTGTETLDFNIKWHATFQSASATKLNAAALTITSLTTGTTDASFANSIIPPGVRVWGVASGFSAGNRPSYFEGTLVCYKLNRSY